MNTRRNLPAFALASSLIALGSAVELQAQVTEAEYARAEQFLSWNVANQVTGIQSGFFGLLTTLRWLDGDRFWYRNRVSDGYEFVLVDPGRGVRQPAFDHARLAAVLSVAADTSYVGHKLPFDDFEFVDNGRVIQFHVGDSLRWRCDTTANICTGPDSVPRRPASETESPDGRWVAFERDENLWVRAVGTGEEVQLSRDGEQDFGYAVIPEGCCQEITSRRQELKRPPVLRWSPNSKLIATHLYGADDIIGDQKVRNRVKELQAEYGHLPVCMAKTQYSFSTDPNMKGAPRDHVVPIREVRLSAGAGFVVVVCGDIMTMPCLPRVPAANKIHLNEPGQIEGLF